MRYDWDRVAEAVPTDLAQALRPVGGTIELDAPALLQISLPERQPLLLLPRRKFLPGVTLPVLKGYQLYPRASRIAPERASNSASICFSTGGLRAPRGIGALKTAR
jgi:hypothetical protein